MDLLIRKRSQLLVIALVAALAVSGCTDSNPTPPGGNVTANNGTPDTGGDDDANVDTPDTGDDAADPDAVDTPDVDVPDADPPDTDQPDTNPPDTDRPDTDPPDMDNGPQGPELLEISPGSGPVDGGTPMLVLGNYFDEGTEVFLGTRPLQQVQVLNSRQLIGRTPPGTVGTVDVKVVGDLGDDVISGGFTYFESLRADTVSPNRGATTGGEVILLRGGGFTRDTLVTIGGRAAIAVDFLGSRTLQVTTPPGLAGRVDVRVTDRNSSAQLAGGFTYYTPLEIDRVFPGAGPRSGGTQVTLAGSGFDDDTTVRFGDIDVAATFVSDTELTVRTPPGPAGFVNITVMNDNGISGLVDGFFYTSPGNDAVTLHGIGPNMGPSNGGQIVTLIGENLDGANLSATIGGAALDIIDSSATTIVGRTPAGTPGTADVQVTTADGTATLPNAYQYLTAVVVDSIDPGAGPVEGGNAVTISGAGFAQGAVVLFGPQRAVITSVSPTQIEVVAPAGALGATHVTVRVGDLTTVVPDGYEYTQPINIYGLSPAQGSVAGGTFVVVRGVGFPAAPESIRFGNRPGAEITFIDNSTLSVRTPAGQEGAVDVTVSFGDTEVRAPDRFIYFNPGTRFGGAWGNAITGAVNVSVFSSGGGAIENAYVTLSIAQDSRYAGFTNAGGQVTFSGPDLAGRQSVTAIAAGYSSATVESFNAENITVFLSPLDGNGSPPGGPPTGTITGYISGVEKIGDPGPNEFELALCETTRPSPFRGNPPTGNGNVVLGNGEYTLISRVGDLAVVCVAGLFNNLTEEFRPLFMGVRRYLFVSDGQTYNVDIEVDIPLNNPLTFKVQNAPRGNPGPNMNEVIPLLDFGFEGVFGGLDTAEGDGEFVTAEHQPHLDGVLEDLSFYVYGGAWTNRRGPYSLAILPRVENTEGVIELPPLLGVPIPENPRDGGRVVNNYVELNPNSNIDPDFYLINLELFDGTPVWEIILPGTQPFFQLPVFPDFRDLPEEERPAPYVGGPLAMYITTARAIEFDYDNFEYNDFGLDNWEVFTSTAWVIQLR